MEPDLLGYLLNSLDDAERRAVDQHLETHAQARRQLVALRHWLQPLADDAATGYEPSGDLLFRTLRSVAGMRGRQLAREMVTASRPRVLSFDGARPRRWRRADVLVAACIALLVLLLVPPAVLQVRHRQQILACADNLYLFHEAMQHYADDRNGALPTPESGTPFNNAGIYGPKLRAAGLWTGKMQVNCPANNRFVRSPTAPPSLEDLAQQAVTDLEEYEHCLKQMGGCYAYNLGYEKGGRYVPVTRGMGDDTPIMSDRPFREEESAEWQLANSPNHGRRGQNVLFLGGHVRFVTNRVINDDDIFLNKDRRLAPGRDFGDAVLAPSETKARVDPALNDGD